MPGEGKKVRETWSSGMKTGLDRDAILELARGMGKRAARQHKAPSRNAPLFDPSKADFATLDLFQDMEMQRAAAQMAGLENPYFHVHDGHLGPTTRVGGREYVSFAGYDYLGLNTHKKVAEAAKKAIDTYGMSASASRPTAGNRPVHEELERRLAELYGAEGALIFVSGHATNVSTIGLLAGPGDLVIHDRLSHNSIVTGAQLSGAVRMAFDHADLVHLEKLLATRRGRFNRVLIVVEGYYSMDGDVADLEHLVRIKEKYAAWLMVDEAHALGVLGNRGLGLFEHCGVDPARIDIWMGTLSKTLCGCGGYIAGSSVLIELLKYHAPGFMYSVGMPPAVAAASLQALDIMLKEPERVERLHENGQLFLRESRKAGLDTGLSEGYAIVPVIVGDSLRAVKLSNLLLEHGIFTIPVLSPAVPEKAARIRFFITSEHSRQQIKAAVEKTCQLLKQLERENFGLSRFASRRDEETG